MSAVMDLEKRGWKTGVFDICWLACDRPGFVHEVVAGKTIVLCVHHMVELEKSVKTNYWTADPPEGYEGTSVYWPWVDYDEESFGWGLQAAADVVRSELPTPSEGEDLQEEQQ